MQHNVLQHSWSNWLSENASDWTPRAMCVNENPIVIVTQILGDLLIALAYFGIPILLWYFARQKKDMLAQYWKVFVLFGLFILLCGTTHIFNIVMFWHPLYWMDSGLKILTGIVSLMTLVMLASVLPTALQIQSPTEVERERLDLISQQSEILKPIIANLTKTKAKLQVAENEALVAQTESALLHAQIPIAAEKAAGKIAEVIVEKVVFKDDCKE